MRRRGHTKSRRGCVQCSLSRRRSLAGISTSSVTPRETSTLLSDTSRALCSPAPEGLLNLRHIYLLQAIALQTHGVSLFNVAQLSQVDRSNCVSFLIYSGILGHHLLADALSFRDQPIDEFLAEYAWCARLHRGVRTIAASSWPLLMESELTGMLSWSQEYLLRKPTGQECSRIRVMVAASASLTGGERQACMEAINFLQVGFDSVLSADWEELGKEAGSKGNKHQMTYSWSVVVAPEFMALLVDKRPESLVVLGYFCVLLHYARETWQIRDAGRYVFEMVEQCLGEAWRCWLDWPRRMIASD
ncbi:hypothetical protein QC761_704340 [Podospora bellae-mahoneyi]|uniref:C6 finger domain protein n=1 Tax=Podospora bellae-mahoneyi TaxID=2093777 RepID=A0ABR0F732_9PEZI|nr:hypothetical protein QC761_704340 [Podospora bellae-mahoneyi]